MNEKWNFGKLNEYQRAAVEDLSPACVVRANVGSGKTTVLVAKVKYLHEVQQVPYEDMVVLTFTNKAAKEIWERLGIQVCEENFGTFHSVALHLLKGRLADALDRMDSGTGWNRSFSVMDPDEEQELAQELIAEYGFKIKYKNRLKKRLEEEGEKFSQGRESNRYQDELYRLFPIILEEKKKRNQMSFSDLIRVCTELLAEQKKVWPAWILVDEMQDSDRQQMEFLLALRKTETRFFAVGDPNQVIYSWRGGTETMFYQIKNHFQAKELVLPVNYRSSAGILEAAARFMQNGDRLIGNRGTGEKILVKNHYDPFQEAVYLAQRMKELHAGGIPYSEMAVFYRKQNQADVIAKVLEKEEIPFSVSLRKTVKDIPVLDWVIRVLKYSCNEEDIFSGESVLMDKVYGEGKTKKTAKKIISERRFAVSPLYDRMCGYEAVFDRGNVDNIKEEKWYQYFSFDEYLHPTSSSYRGDREMLHRLFQQIYTYCVQHGLSLYQGTREYLKSAALYGSQIMEPEEAGESVRLMTLHASKGLEFSHVFLIGVNQGLIPLPGKTPEAEEEERRLFFVGMTRARDTLELSYYTNPGQPGVLGGPGWYLKMLPEHLLDWKENRGEEDKKNHLQVLRRAVAEKRKSASEDSEKENAENIFTEWETKDEIAEQKTEEAQEERKARHPRYGIGVIVSEDDSMVEVEFENYGKKQFVKAFSGLTYL